MAAVIATPERIDLRRLPVLAKRQIDKAELPKLYKAAVAALRECYQLDELKDIDDKHSAIAHYAKQIKDESLLFYAKRIRLRAFERIGELLSDLAPSERTDYAKRHGVSHMDANHAVRAINIPKKVRDQLIESTPPPSKKDLALHGDGYTQVASRYETPGFRRYRDKEEEVRPSAKTQGYELLHYIADIWLSDVRSFLTDRCGRVYRPSELAAAIDPRDAEDYRKQLVEFIEILDELESALPKCVPAN
jgi:hypothetical protein